uniref:Caspase family p10 domain-containing protein n=1 Tax=Hucho hucho TaxID=62062 RepID=A0A4W5K1C0_9TELE
MYTHYHSSIQYVGLSHWPSIQYVGLSHWPSIQYVGLSHWPNILFLSTLFPPPIMSVSLCVCLRFSVCLSLSVSVSVFVSVSISVSVSLCLSLFVSISLCVCVCVCVSISLCVGYFSHRETLNGSWYIQDLCEVLLEYGARLEITEMLTLVNRRVSLRRVENCADHNAIGKKQVPCYTSMLTKKLYFRSKKL